MKIKKKRNWITLTIVLIAILVIIGGIVIGLNYNQNTKPKSSNNNPGDSQQSMDNSNNNYQVPVYRQVTEQDYTNLEDILKDNEMIQKLPEDSIILLSFYNFNTGERSWEKSYLLTRGNIEQGTTGDYDIKLIMHSKYLTTLKADNLCDIFQTAKKNNDFGSETELSTLSLAWKFKSMMNYKDCLGL